MYIQLNNNFGCSHSSQAVFKKKLLLGFEQHMHAFQIVYFSVISLNLFHSDHYHVLSLLRHNF